MFDSISVLAGDRAFEIIKDEGLDLARVKVFAGASGAAKFLILTGIDRVLMPLLKHRKDPLHLIGSSIGAFRMAAYAHKEPIKAINTMEYGYIHQFYPSKRPGKDAITDKSIEIMNSYIKDGDIDYILNNPDMTISFLAAKSRHLAKSENNIMQTLNLAVAATANYINRRYLGYFFERAVFSSVNDINFRFSDTFRTHRYLLTKENFKKALMASGSIPVMMRGVPDIAGAPGMFRDGGMIDYHLDIPFLDDRDRDRLVLFPHFYEYVIPGWLDKYTNRRARVENLKNTVIIAPSRDFVHSLPYHKIPDRKDFNRLSDEERVRYWNTVVNKNHQLGDELHEAIESGRIRKIVKKIQ